MKIPDRAPVAHLPAFPLATFKGQPASSVSRLQRRYEYARMRLTLHERAHQRLQSRIATPVVIGIVLSVFGLPIIAHSLTTYGENGLSVVEWMIAYVLYVPTAFVVGACTMPTLWIKKFNRWLIKDQRRGFKSRPRALFTWIIIVATGFAWLGMSLLSPDKDLSQQLKIGLAAGMSLPAVILGLAVVLAVLVSPFDWIAARTARAEYPDARIAVACARVLANEPGIRRGHDRLYHQRAQVAGYEELARLIERDLQKALRTTVPSANAWTEVVTREMAAAQREAQRNVFFGDPHLGTEQVRNTLIAALTENWSLAPRAEYSRTDQQRRLLARMGASFRLAFIGVVPLGTLLALRHFDIVRDIPESVILLAFGWMVTTLLGVIDPSLGSRVSVFKDALGTLGPGK